MKRLLIFVTVAALAVARPELYKEQEDFQFSRSSSDDGTKAGYYGARRGNMGGNYERAHNMDSLAQNQMSGLVRQVEGELGDGAKTRAGSVYSAANSRGTYGSGHFDLSNLAGRNFQEGNYYDNSKAHSSQAQSSQAQSAYNSADYRNSHSQNYDGSRYGGYQRSTSDAQTQVDDLQSLDNSQTNKQYNYGRSASHSSGYQSHSGFQEHSEYDSSNANSHSGYGSNVRTRLVSATPVKIVLTPGGRVAIPIAAQTYDATQGSSVIDQNALNSEIDLSNQNHQGSSYRLPASNAKRYESSYSYRKKWEKHDTIPTAQVVVTPTESPIPKNSELYEDSDARRSSSQHEAAGDDSHSAHSSSASSRYNAAKSSSSQSRYQANYNTQQHDDLANSNPNVYSPSGYNTGSNHAASSDSLRAYQGQFDADSRYHGASSAYNTNAYTQTAHSAGSHSDLNSQVEDLSTRPKSYHSSYAYHKSWERQGDPYIIKPATNEYSDSQSSQRLSSSTKNSAAYHSGSHYGHDEDCDETGHRRVARSYGTDNVEQESQKEWSNLENLNQQTQSNMYQENLGQQSQNTWENLEDLNQQSQVNWDQQNEGQQSQSKWDTAEDLVLQQQQQQQTDTQDIGLNSWDKVQDFGQQSKNYLGEYGQAYEKELGYKSYGFGSRALPEQQSSKHTSEKESEDQKFESPWKTFDTESSLHIPVDQTQERGTDNQFYWLQNSEKNQQNTNNPYDNAHSISQPASTLNNNFQDKLDWARGGNLDQHTKNLDNPPYYTHIHYEYSNGFANPYSVHVPNDNVNDESLFRENRDHYESHNSSVHSDEYHNNHEYTAHTETNLKINDFEHSSQPSPPLKVWDKFDKIEKASGLSDHVHHSRVDQKYEERNLTSISSDNGVPVSVYHPTQSQTDKSWAHSNGFQSNSILKSQGRQLISEYEVDTLSPPTFEQPPVNVNVSQNAYSIQNSSSVQPEGFHDIGRGDIDPEDLSRTIDAEIIKTNIITEATNGTQQNIHTPIHNGQYGNQVSALSLDQQQKEKEQAAKYNDTAIHTLGQDIQHNTNNLKEIVQQDDKKDKQNQNFLWQNVVNSDRSVNLEEHNTSGIDQQNVQDFGQQEINIESQNLYARNQNNEQNFEQHDDNLQKHRRNDFEQKNAPNFEQQNENVAKENRDNFGQENLQGFGQQHESLGIFLQEFSYQNSSLEQQHVQNLSQENVNDFGQHISNLEQQSLHNFGQETIENFGQHNKNLEKQSSHNISQIETEEQHTEQHNMKHLYDNLDHIDNNYVKYIGQEGEHLEQQNYNNVEHIQEQVYGQQFLQPSANQENENKNKTNLQLFFPAKKVLDEPVVTGEYYKDVKSNQPRTLDSDNGESALDIITEKPGFWQSVGNKFSNAKNKVASWFKS